MKLSLTHFDLILGMCDFSKCPYVLTIRILPSNSISTVLMAYLLNSANPREMKARTNGFLIAVSKQ